ncbi:MAG: alpha-amylase family glycosyl hydrolase [Syntrophaceae bacterium]
MFEFHISRRSRDLYRFDSSLFSTTGNVIFASMHAAREFAEKMNKVRDAAAHPDRSVSASDINAMGLIDEVLHYMIDLYRRQVNPRIMQDAYEFASARLDGMDKAISLFPEIFPPLDVYQGRMTVAEYLDSDTLGVSHRHVTLEEMLLLFIANENPALRPYRELFEDSVLRSETPYVPLIASVEEFLRAQKPFGPHGQSLYDLLLAPMRAAPHSLQGQLEYIRKHWGSMLADLYIKILGGIDLIREEKRARFLGPGPALVPSFGPRELEDLERFSPDVDWMASLVLMAKSVYVWLFQLSRKYGREIRRLDQIPDEELENLARWGFSGLWLIGIWERSPGSRKIKQLTGNPEAAPSAYSIYDYVIASDLGGDDAFENLKARAMRHGIRMATDMVPNHVGIYSKWIVEHPDWFIQLDHSPFPAYSFTGPNLSEDDRVVVQIEDGYWDRRDAAVVFRRIDTYTGQTRYIYHGNDGTSMPWNDTAQLDLLRHEVRQALINTTIGIARKFPIIRFDAAMTLAKRHFQRLWYPPPGYGGDIPSRSGHGVSQEEFDRRFPVEFWRELVDAVAGQAPNTLLLAEAFWLMEGYFVRSLGMHRVYNSAFMNMLKTEENSKYRDVMKNVLRFNPEILKRFVNFMNNPDEEPAVAQFGKDDKYFGVATLMATLPGLPMFGHGQVEGFSEKYGMEYQRSYWDETVDENLVRRHEREIFPLLKKRHLFSGMENFVLYDVRTLEGHVNEDVFAYSNVYGDERSLVVYNNRYAEASGFIQRSVGMNLERSGKKHILHKVLAEGLMLKNEDALYYVFREEKAGLEYLRSSRSLWKDGLLVHLGAFKSHVFTSFTELVDRDGMCRRLEDKLMGGGVPDVMIALRELFHEKVLQPFGRLLETDLLRETLREGFASGEVAPGFRQGLEDFLSHAREFLGAVAGETSVAQETVSLLEALFSLARMRKEPAKKRPGAIASVLSPIPDTIPGDLAGWRVPLIFSLVCRLGNLTGPGGPGKRTRALMDEWMLNKAILDCLARLGVGDGRARYELLLMKILVMHQGIAGLKDVHEVRSKFGEMLSDEDVRVFVGFNLYDDRWWFNKESMETFVSWISLAIAVGGMAAAPRGVAKEVLDTAHRVAQDLLKKVSASGYEVQKLMALLQERN